MDEDNDSNNMNSFEPGMSYNDYYIGAKGKSQMRKTKNMAVSEFNNKRFDKRLRTGKSCSYIKNKNCLNNNNNKLGNKINFINDDNIINQNNNFNLEEERKNLIQMASMKNLQHNFGNTNKYNYNYNKETPSAGVSNIVEQFFLRQLENN